MPKKFYRLSPILIGLGLLFISSSAFSQTISRIYGDDCAGTPNEFQFDCSDCTFVDWKLSGDYTIDSDNGIIIDVHWNSPGSNWIRAEYASVFGYSIFVQYDVNVPNPITPTVTLSETSSPSKIYSNSSISFVATPTNGGPSPSYSWSVNGVYQTTNSSGTFTWSSWQMSTNTVTVQVNSGSCADPGTSDPITITPIIPSNYIQESIIQVSGMANADDVPSLPVEQNNAHTTYYDGLGRPMQSVGAQLSPSKLDIVQPVVYDIYGRESKKYLPITAESNGFYKPNEQIIEQLTDPVTGQKNTGNYTGIAASFYSSGGKVASDTRPYSEIVFEPSPLNRPLQDFGPGQSWKDNNKYVGHSYEVNNANDVVLFIYDPSTGFVSTGSSGQAQHYNANQLQAKRTTDEHGNDVIEYVDKLGHTVCKKVQYGSDANGKLYASTYYIYDDLNNLVVVLPPEGVNALTK